MTINERIRYFRKEVRQLNQRQFAADLGMAQTGVSGMERDGATVTDRAIRSICLAYGVNEEWLRTGSGPIYAQQPTFSLDQFVAERGGTALEMEILKAYFELDQETRKTLLDHFKTRLSGATAEETIESPPEQTADLSSSVQRAEEEYIKSVFGSAQKESCSASSTTGGTEAVKASNE